MAVVLPLDLQLQSEVQAVLILKWFYDRLHNPQVCAVLVRPWSVSENFQLRNTLQEMANLILAQDTDKSTFTTSHIMVS